MAKSGGTNFTPPMPKRLGEIVPTSRNTKMAASKGSSVSTNTKVGKASVTPMSGKTRSAPVKLPMDKLGLTRSKTGVQAHNGKSAPGVSGHLTTATSKIY